VDDKVNAFVYAVKNSFCFVGVKMVFERVDNSGEWSTTGVVVLYQHIIKVCCVAEGFAVCEYCKYIINKFNVFTGFNCVNVVVDIREDIANEVVFDDVVHC
jgi:hypothetical protein